MRVLIISPRFPPVNAADMHRVRMLLPYMKENGVMAEVLAVEPNQVACSRDPWLESTLPPDVRIHRVQALGIHWGFVPGLGELAFRALWSLGKKGDQLLASGNFDLVYFSTTAFEVHVLGPRWKRKFGVPFVLDYQDPWVNDYYKEQPTATPPGGRLKYGVIDFFHRKMEPRVLKECLGITSVSPAYPTQIAKRYPSLNKLPHLIIPFPGDANDLQQAVSTGEPQSIFTPNDGFQHWVYAGVVIPAMLTTLRALFQALKDFGSVELLAKIRLHFIGTSYAPGSLAVPLVAPLAEEFDLAHLIVEKPTRIPYSQVLRCLHDADALLVIGSNDASYTASKVYPYLLARKPLLTVFHKNSSVVELIQTVHGAVCVPFTDENSINDISRAIGEKWLTPGSYNQIIPLDENAFEPYSAQSQAKRLVAFWKNLAS